MAKRRGAIYARYSSHNQRSESIEIQLEGSRAYCLENDINVVGEYCDYAQTGTNTDRAQFQAMMADAKRGLFDCLVIYKVTRIMRNRDEMALARIMLKKCGVEILYAGEDIAGGSSGVLQLGMLELLAEYESALDSERIRDGIRKNAQKHYASGVLLYGWDIVDKVYQVNEREAHVLRGMKDMLLDGSIVADIVRAYDAERTRKGKKFTHSSIIKLLKRKQNAGVYCYAGEEAEGGMPELWPMEEQMMIWKILGDENRPRKRAEGANYVLTGKLFCGPCDHHMVGTSGTSKTGAVYYYYKCKKCNRKVRKDVIEQNVADAVIEALKDADTREKIADLMCEYEAENAGPKQSDILGKQIQEIDTTFTRVWDAIEKGYAPPGGKERIEELTERRELLAEELRVAKSLEAVNMERDRVLFWLENISATVDPEAIISTFVSRVTLVGDDLHILFTFDDINKTNPENPGSYNGPMVEHRPTNKNLANGIYIVYRGFVIVTKYRKGAR